MFLTRSSSTFLNLSMLCADGYSLLFSVLMLNYVISGAFLVAYVVIIVGLLMYHVPNPWALQSEAA